MPAYRVLHLSKPLTSFVLVSGGCVPSESKACSVGLAAMLKADGEVCSRMHSWHTSIVTPNLLRLVLLSPRCRFTRCCLHKELVIARALMYSLLSMAHSKWPRSPGKRTYGLEKRATKLRGREQANSYPATTIHVTLELQKFLHPTS